MEPTQANDTPSFTSASFEQPENRFSMVSTFDVSNEDRSRDANEEQPKKR